MNTSLAVSGPYQVYPAGVGNGPGFETCYWHIPFQDEGAAEPGHCSAVFSAQNVLEDNKTPENNNPDLSPKSSSSGAFAFYTPDSATSSNSYSLSPKLTSTPQRTKEDSSRGRKVKTRTAFSQKQLQILHTRFQNQKYLSPQQIRELATSLELTYKQVCALEKEGKFFLRFPIIESLNWKRPFSPLGPSPCSVQESEPKQIKTWFQNQRMKFKRTQKETIWTRKGMCQPQNSYRDINPGYHPSYSIADHRNIHPLVSMHENHANNPPYGNNQNYGSSDYQIYGSPQNFYPVVGSDDGSFFGKTPGASYSQQAISYISQQKMNFCHGFSASVEYATVKVEDGYPFSGVSANAAAALPSTSVLQHCQAPFPTQGAQSNCSL